MKKLFMLLCTLFAIGLTGSGCSDDKNNDDGGEPSIVGRWRLTFESGYIQYAFNADGTGSVFELDDGELDYSEHFTYLLQGDVLTLTLGDGEIETYTILSFQANRIRWIDPDGYTGILNRID